MSNAAPQLRLFCINAVASCSLFWSLPGRADDTNSPRSTVRAEAITAFTYTPNPAPDPGPIWKAQRPNSDPVPIDPTVVAMAPVIVHASRGLSRQQIRTIESSIQQQDRLAAEPKLPFVKMHEYKLSRKLYFAYVSIFGVPVAGGFSW